MRYIALPSNTKFGKDEDGREVYVPKSDKPWMVWDAGEGEHYAFCDTKAEATEAARILSEIDEEEWQAKEWGD